MTTNKVKYATSKLYNRLGKADCVEMGLSLNNIYQRPYVNQNLQNQVKKRNDDEKSSAAETRREEQSNNNSRSKGLQYTETQKPTYTPAYEQKFNIGAGAYSSVNINANSNQYSTAANTVNANTQSKPVLNTQINIAQILKDFKNTAIAIGTPAELSQEVNAYISLIETQVKKDHPNAKLVKSNLKNAASILDNHISETLGKESKVVENWVDTLFIQNINYKYDENDINERFLVKFPDGTTSQTKREEELQETTSEEILPQQENSSNVIPLSVAGSKGQIPQDKQLKSLFIKAKKYAYAKNPEKAIRAFEQALNRANEIDDTETSGKIYFEVGKIYDNHDYLPQALKSYHRSIKLSTDENVKSKAYYSMAQIYDDVNQVTPALDHYVSAVSHAGEAENLPAQSASLTKIGNIYTDMYDKEAFVYYDIAQDLAQETDNCNLKGFVASHTGKAYKKFDEPQKALKAYSAAVKNYTEAETPMKTAQNYIAASDIMLEFNNIDKARKLLTKAQKFARQTDNVNLMKEINIKINRLENTNVK